MPKQVSYSATELLESVKLSEFQRRVFTLLVQVPAGKVTSYGRLAEALGIRSAQAVGQALRHNPHAPQIPCHRVVQASGSVGGYAGDSTEVGICKKREMLQAEGVGFGVNGKVLAQDFYSFE